jgi:hypothetical protein
MNQKVESLMERNTKISGSSIKPLNI